MNDLKTACPKCEKRETSTLYHAGFGSIDRKNGTIPAKCRECGWEGRVLFLFEFGLMKQEMIACTKDHPWDMKTLPVHHADADFMMTRVCSSVPTVVISGL